MRVPFKKNLLKVLSYILILSTFLPVVTNNLPPVIGSYHLYAALWLVSTIIFASKIYRQKLVILFLFYGLVFILILPIFLWKFMNDWNREAIQLEFYNMFIPLTVFYYYRINNDYKGWAKLVKMALIFIGITAIMTYIASSFNPMYARNITSGDITDSELAFFKRIGGGSYGYAIALLGLFPLLIYYYKHNIKSIFPRKFIFVYIVLIYFAIIRMQFFANIIVSSIIIILVSFVGAKNIKYSIVSLSFILIIGIITPNQVYSDILIQSSSWFNKNSETYLKLNDMAGFIIGDTEDSVTEQRAERFPELAEAFIRKPLLGDASYESGLDIGLGAHLYWMNRLAIWGIVALSFFVWLHYKYILSGIRYFDKTFTYYFLLSVGAILSYGLIKNISGREIWYAYFVILPGMYYLPSLKKKETVNRSK